MNKLVAKILEKSKPSPFRKGDKTVMDLKHRNWREVEVKDMQPSRSSTKFRSRIPFTLS
jgi:hypothetical protein